MDDFLRQVSEVDWESLCFFSLLAMGIAYMAANASNSVIGWENLSGFWKSVFILEAILFIIQLAIIILIHGKNNWTQIVLTISYVFYTYKMALDPFVAMSMFAKDRGVYEIFAPLIIFIIILGFLLHLFLVWRSFKGIKKERDKANEKRGNQLYVFIPVLFLLVSVTGYIIKNDLLGENDVLAGMGIFTFFYLSLY
ncbi:hypothetical protein SPD48_04520 [Pseudogracilibacillus sp. SE30717A]|uniref:hypothetical protein n=1 Tax=Pseudogracilibacillus sp. SE30717A TaxID=3098293 RepID=UPI00300E3CC5